MRGARQGESRVGATCAVGVRRGGLSVCVPPRGDKIRFRTRPEADTVSRSGSAPQRLARELAEAAGVVLGEAPGVHEAPAGGDVADDELAGSGGGQPVGCSRTTCGVVVAVARSLNGSASTSRIRLLVRTTPTRKPSEQRSQRSPRSSATSSPSCTRKGSPSRRPPRSSGSLRRPLAVVTRGRKDSWRGNSILPPSPDRGPVRGWLSGPRWRRLSSSRTDSSSSRSRRFSR